MDKLLYAALGLGAAYLVFGKGTNNPLPQPPAGGSGSITNPNNFVPVTQPTVTTGLMLPGLHTTTLTAYASPAANIGARSYGNCQCADGSYCVGQGNCACCQNKGGAIKPHTLILPVVKATAMRVSGCTSCNSTMLG